MILYKWKIYKKWSWVVKKYFMFQLSLWPWTKLLITKKIKWIIWLHLILITNEIVLWDLLSCVNQNVWLQLKTVSLLWLQLEFWGPTSMNDNKIAGKDVLKIAFFFFPVPGGSRGKNPTFQCRRHKRYRLDPWVGKILWRKAQQPIPVFLPGESHGQRSLAGYSP